MTDYLTRLLEAQEEPEDEGECQQVPGSPRRRPSADWLPLERAAGTAAPVPGGTGETPNGGSAAAQRPLPLPGEDEKRLPGEGACPDAPGAGSWAAQALGQYRRRGPAGAELLYRRVRAAQQGAAYVRHGPPDGGVPLELGAQAPRGLTPAALDRLVERDARRYDAGFPLL